MELLEKLEFKYITKYIGFIKNDDHLNIILEYIEGGSLATIVSKYGGTGEGLCARYVAQMLLGLCYLHERGIIHRDIKWFENFLSFFIFLLNLEFVKM